MSALVQASVFFTSYQGRWSWEDRVNFHCEQKHLLTEGMSRVSDWMERRNRNFGDTYTQARVASLSWCDDDGFWHTLRPEAKERWVHLPKAEAQVTASLTA